MEIKADASRNVPILAASGLLSAGHRRDHHRRSAAHPALHRDRTGGTIELARTAFHAVLCVRHRNDAGILIEHRVRTDGGAYAAAVAFGRIELECGGLI